MAEYINEDNPIIIKNETDSDFNVGAGIVFQKSGIYEITITDSTITVTKISERKTGRCDSSNILRYPGCENRTKLGNCNPVGGFCTSVPKDICDAQNHRQNVVDIIHIDPAKIVRDKLWEKAIKREKKEAPQAAEDTISRKAVLELTMQYCPDDNGTCSKAGSDIRELLDDIEDLPSAQPQRTAGHWIPCKKDHPIKPGHYLCSFDRHNYIDEIYVGLAYWTGGRWYGYVEGRIEAWQPLPEQYREGK